MNNIGEKINVDTIGQREFDVHELFNAIARTVKSMSWGSHAWRTINSTGLRFRVQGQHHKGHVYIILGWDDTFTLYFTKVNGEILEVKENIYVDVLIETIDNFVEYIPAYGNN